jgi:hypothetical protein
VGEVRVVSGTRHEELAARAKSVQECGPVTNYLGAGSDGLARVRCAHGHEWSEWGDEGHFCRECSDAAMAVARERYPSRFVA